MYMMSAPILISFLGDFVGVNNFYDIFFFCYVYMIYFCVVDERCLHIHRPP